MQVKGSLAVEVEASVLQSARQEVRVGLLWPSGWSWISSRGAENMGQSSLECPVLTATPMAHGPSLW